jgi:hypothetical protein
MLSCCCNLSHCHPLTMQVDTELAGSMPLLDATDPSVGVALRTDTAVPTTPAQMATLASACATWQTHRVCR